MLSNMDNIILSSTGTQTEQLTSPILWHCFQVVKSVPEFKSLSCRVTMDMNGHELLIISRDQVTRVFGPPVEPISLTLDPSGKCLLAIPFRPVQHIPITKSKLGMLELSSLHALLRLVSGKGFCFCPGIPAKFLAGRACGKFVVMHRTPFKRFSAMGCPVYFKLPKLLETTKDGSQLPIRTLCPSCRTVAKWAQTLPVSQSMVKRPPVIKPIPQNQVYSVPLGNTASNRVVMNNSSVPPENQKPLPSMVPASVKEGVPASGAFPLTIVNISKFDGSNYDNVYAFDNWKRDRTVSDRLAKRRAGLNSEKAQAVSDSLRQLLRQRSMIRDTDLGKYKMEGSRQNGGGEKSLESSRPRSPRSDKSKKNVCHICRKQFSTNLRLSKHVQRHEGNRPMLSRSLHRKIPRHTTPAALNRLFRGVSSHLFKMKRNKSMFSDWSLQHMLDSLNDFLSNEKRLNMDVVKADTVVKEQKKSRGKRKAEEHSSQQHGENLPTRPGLHRSGSGLAAVQTLLNAAQLADVDDVKACNINNSNNYPTHNGFNSELSNADTATNRDADSPSHAKKARQSGRLAAKRAGKKTKHGASVIEATEANDLSLQGNDASNTGHPSDEALTNLNLLSAVSQLQAEQRDIRGSPGLQLLSFAGNLNSNMNNATQNLKSKKQSALSQSYTAESLPTSNLDQITAPRHQIPITVMSKEDTRPTKNNALPPIPPLILAKDTVFHNHSPLSSATSSPLVPLPPSAACALPILQQIQNSIAKGHCNALTTNVNLLPREDVLGSSCEAMDLSKPKSGTVIVSKDKDSPLPKDSAEVLRHLMMINPVPLTQNSLVQPELTHDPRIRLLSSKEADDSLQARMFASAKNYKVDPSKIMITGHIPAAVSTSASTTLSKQVKGKEKFNLPLPLNDKSEIQCGYKWSGSGGLVKERTQLVRELVPSVIMANILNGPVTNSLPKMDDPISAPMQNVTKQKVSDKQQQEQQLTAKSSQPPVPMTSQNSPNPHHITLKPREAPVRPKTPQYVLNLSKNRNDQDAQSVVPASVQLHSKSSPVSFPASILKTSLLNTPSVLIPKSIFAQKPPVQNPITSSMNKKVSGNTSVLAPLRSTVLATLPNSILPASQIPNSTLATILRHPPKMVGSHALSKAPDASHSVTVSSVMVPISAPTKSNTVFELSEIKKEPFEIYEKKSRMRTVMPDALGKATVVKIEDSISESTPASADRNLSAPPNLVVDMGAEKNALPNLFKADKKLLSKGKMSIVDTPLKCEFCSLLFRTIRDHDYHVCAKKSQ